MYFKLLTSVTEAFLYQRNSHDRLTLGLSTRGASVASCKCIVFVSLDLKGNKREVYQTLFYQIFLVHNVL